MRQLTALLFTAWALALPAQESAVNGRVALITDYGTQGHYVGALKGAMVRTWPDVTIDDVTHQVPPFDIPGASFTLASVVREWPVETVFVVIIDPGVGTSRRSVALRLGSGHLIVGPDNGLFTLAVAEHGLEAVHEITNAELLPDGTLSTTFHGRDVYGPIGAALASGVSLEAVGPALDDVVRLRVVEPQVAGGRIEGQIAQVDHYGNVITNIREPLVAEAGLTQGDHVVATIGQQRRVVPLLRTYADVADGAGVALINSQGLLELAINQGSMAAEIGAASGDPITVAREVPNPE